ncbi:MAG: Mut7-C RNAse domain-containing protein [Chloroflexota bacterium]
MNQVTLRFYAELNDFLPHRWRQAAFVHEFKGRPSVKDLLEAVGAPHTEIDLILVNGESVDFSYAVQDGDQISVYPVFESLDIGPVVRVRPRPLRESCFVLDTHLGKLATYLRLLGFDTLYRNSYGDVELALISSQEQRILLTKDRDLLKRRMVTHGYYVRASRPSEQLVEVLRRFDLFGATSPFRRCLRCNGLLRPATKESLDGRLPPHTEQYYDEFFSCRECSQVYWKGSHYQRMRQFIERILQERG